MHYWEFSPVFWSNIYYIYGEASHLESYTSTSKFPIEKVNTLRLRQNGRHFADDILKRIFLNENISIPIKI